MNFTDPIPYKCAEYSNQGYFLAISKANELTIFDSDTFNREQHFIFPDTISAIKWSPDDNFLMAVIGKLNEVHLRCFNSDVVDQQQEGWCGTIVDQLGEIEAAIWSADSRQILTWSQSNIRVSVWSLLTQKLSAYISNPKMLPPSGIDFTENKKFAALCERKDCKDVIGIYYAGNDWKIVN